MKNTWRLILSPPSPGAWNMAVDEAILESIGSGSAPPTLRLYAWEPACLSLGRAQPFEDADPIQLRENGWDVVRRATGGRAILHCDELTYSTAGPYDDARFAGGVLESYRRLSAALLAALQNLGLPAEAKAKPQGQNQDNPASGPVCFEVPSNYEITVQGKKLLGSAQARKKAGVLQHGSLPLYGDLKRITQALAYPSEENRKAAADRLLDRATTVELAFGKLVQWQEAAQAFISAFQDSLDLHLEPSALSAEERARANNLVKEKYAHPSWTERI